MSVEYRFSGNSQPIVQAVANINTALSQSTAAAAAAGTAVQGSMAKMGASMAGASASIGKVAQVSGALGGVVGKLNPQVGMAVSSVGALAGVMSGLSAAGVLTTAALGPLAVAVVAGAAAYAYFSRELEKAEAKQAKAAETATRATKVAETFSQIVDAAADHHRVAAGKITAADLAVEKQVIKLRAATAEQEKEISKLGLGYDELVKRKQLLWQREDLAIRQLKEKIPTEGKSTAETLKAKEAIEATRVATEQRTIAEKAMSQALAEVTRSNAAYASSMSTLQTAQATATASQLTGVAAVAAARDADLARARAVFNEGYDAALDNEEKQAALYQQFQAAKVAITEASAAKIAAIYVDDAAAAVDAEKTKQAAQRETNNAAFGATADLFGALSGLYMTDAENKSKSSKKAARESFRVAKAFAITQAIVNTLLGVTNAFATLPYPAAPIAAAAVAISGGVQVASIASQKPSFHAGGIKGYTYPDETSTRTLPGEGHLNRQATANLGAGGVDKLNSGGSMSTTLRLRIGRAEAYEIARTDDRAGGYLRQFGQRIRGMSAAGVGVSGRGLIA